MANFNNCGLDGAELAIKPFNAADANPGITTGLIFSNALYDTSLDQGGGALVSNGSARVCAPDCCSFMLTGGVVLGDLMPGENYEIRIRRFGPLSPPNGAIVSQDQGTAVGAQMTLEVFTMQPPLPGECYELEVFTTETVTTASAVDWYADVTALNCEPPVELEDCT